MFRLPIALLAFAVGCLFSQVATAQWKWRDASGRVQYSDLPPPAGTADAQILQRPNAAATKGKMVAALPPPPAASAAAPAASLPAGKTVEPELEAKRRQAEADQAAKKRAEDDKLAAAKAENCNRAKSHLRAIDDGMRIARVNVKGEREFLDDKARADEAARTRAAISADCR